MYRVVVKGRIGPAVIDGFENFAVLRIDEDGREAKTVLAGNEADQADLYGLLLSLQRRGLELVSVTRVEG